MILIDKDHQKLDGGEKQRNYSTCFRPTPGCSGRSIGIMSALQTFMLVVDHDREEAKRIADGVAQGKWSCPRTASTPITN